MGPDSLPTVRLGDLASMTSGGTPTSSVRQYYGGGIPWVSISDMTSGGKYITQTHKTLSEDGLRASAAKLYEPNVVLYAMYASLGECSISPGRVTSSQAILAIKPGARLDTEFLYYFLQSIKSRVKTMGQHGTQSNLNANMVRDFRIPLPSLAMQSKSTRILGDVDLFISSAERLIAKKQALKHGMMQQLLTGKTRLLGFVGEWSATTFGEVATTSRDRVSPREVEGRVVELEHLAPGRGKVLGDADVRSAVSLKTVFVEGDVLFGKLRAYLRKYWLADRGGYCSTEIWALRARPGVSIGSYIRYIVERAEFIDTAITAYGTHMPRSDWRVVSQFEFDLPPMDEQRAIAEVLLDVDREIEALERRLKTARAIKQGIIEGLITGRTRLTTAEVAA